MATDIYVVLYFSRTSDDHGVYVTKDSSEIIEISWVLLSRSPSPGVYELDEVTRGSALVRPVNTPLTPACTSLTGITWDHLRGQNAGTLADALGTLDSVIQEYVVSKKLRFAFVVYNAFELKVELIREARDKMLMLAPYLQHPRYFDLKTEFKMVLGITQNHSRNYQDQFSLANICASLNISQASGNENINSSPEIPTSPPQMVNPITNVGSRVHYNSNPRRAYEEADLIAKATQLLFKYAGKSGAFLRPCDVAVDYNALELEKSKVVFLSNLPNDVIQSELESWFTQYGARPVALWTLKTPDHHRSSYSGFVVFASHQEAVHCINTMNGRALNDTPVEVAPSGGNVLEMAHDILTSFPTSKNRPRPGDWTCASCRFSNFQRRTSCFRCNYPNVYAANGSGVAVATGGTTGGPLMDGHRPVQQAGYHDMAHGHNYHSHHQNGLNVNGTGNGSSTINTRLNGISGNISNNVNHNNNSGNSNSTNSNNGLGGVAVPFRAGDWKCGNENCNYHNFAKNLTCLRCGASRVTAAVVGGAELYRNNNSGNNGNNGYRRVGVNNASLGMNAQQQSSMLFSNAGVASFHPAQAQAQAQNAYHVIGKAQQQRQQHQQHHAVNEPYMYANMYNNNNTTVPVVPGIPSMTNFTSQGNGFNSHDL